MLLLLRLVTADQGAQASTATPTTMGCVLAHKNVAPVLSLSPCFLGPGLQFQGGKGVLYYKGLV